MRWNHELVSSKSHECTVKASDKASPIPSQTILQWRTGAKLQHHVWKLCKKKCGIFTDVTYLNSLKRKKEASTTHNATRSTLALKHPSTVWSVWAILLRLSPSSTISQIKSQLINSADGVVQQILSLQGKKNKIKKRQNSACHYRALADIFLLILHIH